MNKHKLIAILLGGVALSLISAVPIVGWLWFIWAILSGLLAVLIYRNFNKTRTAQTKECVFLGLGAGVLGGVLMFILALIVSFLLSFMMVWSQRPNMAFLKALGETLEYIIEKNLPLTIMQIVISLVAAVLTIGFATLGGFLGKLFFYKTAAPTQHFSPNLGTIK